MSAALNAIRKQYRACRGKLGGALADRGLWDKTLSPEDLARNQRFVDGLRRSVGDLSSKIAEMERAEKVA